VTVSTPVAIDDVMETCADTAVWSNVIANDIYGESTELKLTVLVTDGEYGSCVISGKKKWGVLFEKTRWSCVFTLSLFTTLFTLTTSISYMFTSKDGSNGECNEEIMYTPAPGFIGVDKCGYEACAVYTDLASGWPEVDPQKCFTVTVTISVIECVRFVTPEVRDRKKIQCDF
jgi:hypothetical protein